MALGISAYNIVVQLEKLEINNLSGDSEGPILGLPARYSVKLCHWHNFQALITPLNEICSIPCAVREALVPAVRARYSRAKPYDMCKSLCA